jgi:sulfide:quinone oxidoreductase
VHSRIVVLGGGFGGLELVTILSERLGDDAGVTLIDAADAFVFGYSKLDVMFGRTTFDEVRLPYAEIEKPGVRILRERITAIDPETRRVTTDVGVHDSDILVVALGADYDYAGTPGLDARNEYYSVEGAGRLREAIAAFTGGRAIVGVCGAPFKCPPAPSEAALLLHDSLLRRGVRNACEISLVMPFSTPVPPSPDTSAALVEAFAERDIAFVPGKRIGSVDQGRGVATTDDGTELAFDLFLGIPKHRAPDVVLESNLAVDGYIPVESGTLATRFPDVYALGDVATVGVPKAGVFAEGAARIVAEQIVARTRGDEAPARYDGRGSCFIEFGGGRIGRVSVDFFSGPKPTGSYQEASAALVAEKEQFGAIRRARWFGR